MGVIVIVTLIGNIDWQPVMQYGVIGYYTMLSVLTAGHSVVAMAWTAGHLAVTWLQLNLACLFPV